VVVGTWEGLLFGNRLWDPCDAFQDTFSGEEAYPSRSCCINDALNTVTTDESGLPDLRIPFSGGADTKDVRTACEVGRGRDDDAAEDSSDEE